MAVRLRKQFDDTWIALCAAEHSAESGDVYVDDAQDHALREKYYRDWRQEEAYLRKDGG